MRRYAAKVDGNQAEIVEILRGVGASVELTHFVGQGFPDILVGFRGETYLVEFKIPGEELTDSQREWHGRWRGRPVAVITKAGDALRLIGAIGEGKK